MVRIGLFLRIAARLLALLLLGSTPVVAQELLVNQSFESPVTLVNGNNFYATIPSWTIVNVVPAQPLPFNIVRPYPGYAGNPTVTPPGGGNQYFDVNSAAGAIRQTVTVPGTGMLDYSGWFSVRDSQQALAGLTINIRDSSGTVIATSSTSFLASDPTGLWKQVVGTNVPVSAGTYTFEAVLPDPANFDLASLVFKPAPVVTKTSTSYSDPFNSTVNSKMIPGGLVEYLISVTTPGSYAVDNNKSVVADATPAGMELVTTDFAGAGSGPAAFNAGSSGLTYSYADLASATDNLDFSNDNGATWTYAPGINGNGTDPGVTNVRFRPQGVMAASSTFTFRVRYRIK